MCRSVGFRKKVTQGTSLPGQRGGRQGIYEVAGQKLIRLQTEDCVFSLDPSYRRGRVYKLKFCPSVCLSVITSTFSIKTLQIIPESRQTPHIIHHWKEEDISHDDDNDKDTHIDKYKDKDEDNDKDKDKMLKRPITCYNFRQAGSSRKSNIKLTVTTRTSRFRSITRITRIVKLTKINSII